MWAMLGLLTCGVTLEVIGAWMVACLRMGRQGGKVLFIGAAFAISGIMIGLNALAA